MDLASYAATQQQRQDDQFRNLLNMFMTMKQYQQEQGWKQKNYDLNQAETDAVVKWRQAQANKAATPAQAKPSPLVEQAKIMVSEGLYPTIGQAIKAMKGIDKQAKPEKTLADKTAEWETQAKINAKYRPAPAPKAAPIKPDTSPKRNEKLLSSTISAYEKEIDRARTYYGSVAGQKDKTGRAESKATDANLSEALSRLRSIQNKFASTGKLDQIDLDQVMSLNSGLGAAKKTPGYGVPKAIADAMKKYNISYEQAMGDYYEMMSGGVKK
jgi:hypothetical protein